MTHNSKFATDNVIWTFRGEGVKVLDVKNCKSVGEIEFYCIVIQCFRYCPKERPSPFLKQFWTIKEYLAEGHMEGGGLWPKIQLAGKQIGRRAIESRVTG